MSRTFRYIPHFWRGTNNFDRTWSGIHPGPVDRRWDRRWWMGLDKHKATSCVTMAKADVFSGYFQETASGKTRKHYKRQYHKSVRRLNKKYIRTYEKEY